MLSPGAPLTQMHTHIHRFASHPPNRPPRRSGCFLCFIVERAKKCLDFAATVHVLHLLACTAYDGWPSSWEWWGVNLASLVVMALSGEYLCMRREMQVAARLLRAAPAHAHS